MQAIASAELPSEVSHDKVLVIFGGLLLVMLLAALDSTIVATALPTIVNELGGLAHLSWVVTAYLLAQTIVTPIYGKLGDLYGRKRVLQFAIVLFLIGSALCGLSQTMTHLILFRAIQGLGGGGLMVTTQAVVADIIPPRQRGRYQGIFGAAFGVASVAGPLLGGYFTSNLTWRWIFYINLPLGILALIVLAATLPAQSSYKRHAIDYLGAGLLAATLAAVILVTDLGGVAYPLSSPLMIGLIVVAVVGLIAFILIERRAAEPILPLRLFRIRDVWVTSAMGLIIGFALLGSVTYLPLFLQIVKGMSPTESGLRMIPLMGGTLVTSILSGQIASRTGRYKIFPIIGTTMVTIALFLMSRMTAETTNLTIATLMLLLGLGLGFVMQMLIIAVQNAVEYHDLGVATSNAILFRFIGGSLGTALLGAVLATRLLATNSLMTALDTVFVVASAMAFFGLLLSFLLPERRLRETIAAATEADIGGDIGQAFAMPQDSDSRAQLLRGLAVLADRDVRRRYVAAIVTRAGVDLSPAAAWLMVQIEREPDVNTQELGRKGKADPNKLKSAKTELLEKSLIAPAPANDVYQLTGAGCEIYNRLVAARREHLAELWPEWSPKKREDVAAILRQLARELIPETKQS
ncbi:MAG TPA: MFS transporter [Pyrinomonadaceae bacterium]|nr:MFS transporter [Pyrinomonadaceae bacterium]